MGVTDQPAPARGQPRRAARLVLGTAQWGQGYGITNTAGRPSDDEVVRIVQAALDGGIRDVDTHRALRAEQGYGDAQSRLAPWARRFRITTKVFGGTDVPVHDQLCRSLAELQVGAVHACLVHDWAGIDDLRAAEVAASLRALVADGRCAHVGVAAYDASDVVRARKLFGPQVALQVPVSVLDQRILSDAAAVEVLSESPNVHVRSVFAQGLLLPHAVPNRWTEHPDVRRWRDFVEASDVRPLDACLSFASRLPWANGIVVGAASALQLTEIVEAWAGHSVDIEWTDFATTDPLLVDPRRWTA